MRVTIFGAGQVGTALAQGLARMQCVTGIYWINRSKRHYGPAEDIRQGLADTPCCSFISTGLQDSPIARASLEDSTMAIITSGVGLKGDAFERNTLYDDNCRVLLEETGGSESIASLLSHAPKHLKVLVVTNPVDLISRLLFQECGLESSRIMGLGTIPETLRLRSFIAKECSSRYGLKLSSKGIWAYVVGTHDKLCIPVIPRHFSPMENLSNAKFQQLCARAINHVRQAPERVKFSAGNPTIFPIVSAILKVVSAVGQEDHIAFTPSILDPADPDSLFYSMPATIGNKGVFQVNRTLPQFFDFDQLDQCKQALRDVLGCCRPLA